MNEKRFTLIKKGNGWVVDDNSRKKFYLTPNDVVRLLNNLHQENQQLKHYKLYEDNKRLQTIIADLKEENEQLRTQLLICQHTNDNGRFQVWEVPPIPKGTRITFSTTERSGKNE